MSMMLPPQMLFKTRLSLIKHEGCRLYPYFDTSSPPKITIGIGYNLSDRGVDLEWVNKQFLSDVNYFYDQLSKFDWWGQVSEDRQIILIDMAFMGWKRFLEFKEMIKALSIADYKQAAVEMLNSDWAKEVGQRAQDLAQGMHSGYCIMFKIHRTQKACLLHG